MASSNDGPSAARETAQRPGHAPRLPLPSGIRPRSEDSWIEVSSQPSSSSLSSANEEIITTGLRVQHDSNAHRRRRLRNSRGLDMRDLRYQGPASSTGTSSQEEYEESESESDRVLSSSNEALPRSPLHQELRPRSSRALYNSASSDGGVEGSDEDDDENSTAVGYVHSNTEPLFTPQPNAFSHPPSSASRAQQQHPGSFFPTQSRPSQRPATQRHSYSGQPQHTPYNMLSPSHRADHDAALRASLSTLLSLGAAARGLPKSTPSRQIPAGNAASARVDPASLRMIPESSLPSTAPPSVPSPQPATTATTSPSPPRTSPGNEKHKRRNNSKDRRGSGSTAKKARRTAASTSLDGSVGEISPTLLTWVVSAGVVVLVSALSFSAGYVVGREAGRAEVEVFGDFGGCGREVGSGVGGDLGRAGLRRLRFGTPTVASV